MKFCSSTILILALGASADATSIRGVDLGRGLKSGNGKSNAERDMKSGGKNGKGGGKGKGSQASPPTTVDKVCVEEPLEWNAATAAVLSTIPNADTVLSALVQFQQEGITIGSTTALLPEASDASVSGATVQDGMSGDTDFPHGPLKAIATVGERSTCDDSLGEKIVGVPDGLGAYLVDDETVRVVVQSESYGPLVYESYPYPVNNGAATFGGSHVQYVDYNRDAMTGFMTSDVPASSMVTGFGEMIEISYNLKGELVGPRVRDGNTTVGAHYANTDAAGAYVVVSEPAEADWLMQSLCSAHLEQTHQWDRFIGLEDDIFITNEEWMIYEDGTLFVGIGAHAIDIHTKTDYSLGVFGQGGFEKIAEINSQHPDYTMFAVSGYNGDFTGNSAVLQARKDEYGMRPDGEEYVWSENIVPFRIFVGVKGKMEDGSTAPADDFLARNGLRYGKLYGFAIDMSESGPSGGIFRDEFHQDPAKAKNGAKVDGKWIAVDWTWDGEVRNFQHDVAWEFQLKPPGTSEGSSMEDYQWWNAGGLSSSGLKTEHVTPDPRADTTGFVQGSTAGYFGHLYVHDVIAMLDSVADGEVPAMFDGTWYVYQGELDITSQVKLGGKGEYADGRDATRNWDDADGEGKVTFEDIDGLEVVYSNDGKLYAIIQEDSGNDLGERMFITSPLEHEDDGEELTYYFIAMSGGSRNTRMTEGVGIPKGTNCEANAHEFSGIFDMSGLIRKQDGEYMLSASDEGHHKRKQDKKVNINDKTIIIGLQAHNMYCGVIEAFQADRGGQWLLYNPHIPI